jgi:hypothetical protein
MGFTFHLLEGLTLDVKSGLDLGVEFRTQRKPKLTYGWENGFYREQSLTNFEINTDFLLRYEKNFLDGRLTTTTAFGGNNMSYHYRSNSVQLDELDIEGVYHISNVPTGIYPDPSSYRSYKMINSLYGFVSLGWNDTYYLDITGRNDWSSTLARSNWSYFYPSVAASVLLDRRLTSATICRQLPLQNSGFHGRMSVITQGPNHLTNIIRHLPSAADIHFLQPFPTR